MFNNIPVVGKLAVILEYAIVPMGQALRQIPYEIFEAVVCCCDCKRSKKNAVINKIPRPVMTLPTSDELDKERQLKSIQAKVGNIFVSEDRFSEKKAHPESDDEVFF